MHSYNTLGGNRRKRKRVQKPEDKLSTADFKAPNGRIYRLLHAFLSLDTNGKTFMGETPNMLTRASKRGNRLDVANTDERHYRIDRWLAGVINAPSECKTRMTNVFEDTIHALDAIGAHNDMVVTLMDILTSQATHECDEKY